MSGPTTFEVETGDVIKLILQFCKENNLIGTLKTLQEESQVGGWVGRSVRRPVDDRTCTLIPPTHVPIILRENVHALFASAFQHRRLLSRASRVAPD
jgi:hypothetical protein